MSQLATDTNLDSEVEIPDFNSEQIVAFQTRAALFKRLQDVVGLPSSRISPQERHMASDLLIEMLRDSDLPARIKCAERVSLLSDVPALLLRFLARSEIEAARPLLEICAAFDDSDLIAVAKGPSVTLEHRILVAKRRVVNEVVADALCEFGEVEVIIALLKNEGAKLPHPAMETMTAMSKEHPVLVGLLLKRAELKPSQALTMFWWAEAQERVRILQRFAVERLTLLEAAQDIYARAAADGWQDSLVRKSLQFIERRQRNRMAVEKSPFESLEGAVEALEKEFDVQTLNELAYLAGVRPACGAQIFSDPGGEAIAVLCKATGLKRTHFRLIWKGLRRPMGAELGHNDSFTRATYIYDILSTNRAQTVLRYWNWALTSAMSPVLAAKMEDGDERMDYSIAARSSHLVFGR